MPLESKFGALPKRASGQRPTAFLTVQEGCDKFCTYCVVPYTRGAEISRPFADLIAEARALVAGGVREITLLGQNVNAWGGEDEKGRAIGLAGLIRELAREDGLERIRYTTSHPRSEEHTSELQSLMRISYAGFRLEKTHNRHTRKQDH